MFNARALLVFLIFSLSCFSFSCAEKKNPPESLRNASAKDIPLDQSSSNNGIYPLKWPKGTKIRLGVEEDLSKKSSSLVRKAIGEWNKALAQKSPLEGEISSIPSLSYKGISEYYDQTMGVYKSSEWYEQLGKDTLAVTQFFAQMDKDELGRPYLKMLHADILLNFKHYNFEEENFEFDLYSVVLHELGHFLGLRHYLGSEPSVMVAYLGPNTTFENLYSKDKKNISELYGLNFLRALKNLYRYKPKDFPEDKKIYRGIFYSKKKHKELSCLDSELLDSFSFE